MCVWELQCVDIYEGPNKGNGNGQGERGKPKERKEKGLVSTTSHPQPNDHNGPSQWKSLSRVSLPSPLVVPSLSFLASFLSAYFLHSYTDKRFFTLLLLAICAQSIGPSAHKSMSNNKLIAYCSTHVTHSVC